MTKDVTRKAQGEVSAVSSSSEIERFLKSAGPASGSSRLIFALDATMSRQPTWDRATRLQGELFTAVGEAGSLAVQLAYFRGFGECRASRWVVRTDALRDLMTRIDCRGGQTQISKVLAHARREAEKQPVSVLVFIGDAMEEDADALCRAAGELGLLGTKCIMIQERRDPQCERTFREIARLSSGAFIRLDESSADALRNILRAVAVFAAKGLPALEKEGSRESRLLLTQIGRPQGRDA